MENSRIARVMFRTFASLGLFLFFAAAYTSGMEPAPRLHRPAADAHGAGGRYPAAFPKGHPYLDPEVLSEHGLVTFIDREKPDAPRRVWVGVARPDDRFIQERPWAGHSD